MFDPRHVIDKYCPDYGWSILYSPPDDPYYAETVPSKKIIYLTQHWLELDDEGQHYVLLHEAAHAMRPDDSESHTGQFWTLLESLVFEEGIDPVEAAIIDNTAPEYYLVEYQAQAWERATERYADAV